jgi:hypothetical protein
MDVTAHSIDGSLNPARIAAHPLQVLQLFTTASGRFPDARASPAPYLPGDTWLLVVMPALFNAGFSRGRSSAHEGMSFMPRTPGVSFRTDLPTAHAVSPMPLTLASGERCLICVSNTGVIRIHLR